MSQTRLKVNLHSAVAWMLSNYLPETLNDSNEIRTYKDLVRKQTLKHLPKLVKR